MAVLKSEFNKDDAAVSRDGRWVAYQSFESGRWEVYVASYPSFSGKRQVSNAGGCQPLWSRDGKELFYLMLEGKLAVVEVKGSATLESVAPKILFHPAILVNPSQTEYCVTADSKKFIFREPIGDSAARMYVILNWSDGLKHLKSLVAVTDSRRVWISQLTQRRRGWCCIFGVFYAHDRGDSWR